MTGIEAADLLTEYLQLRTKELDAGDAANIVHFLNEKGLLRLHSPQGDELVSSGASWRCFFCDGVFRSRAAAAEHFGTEVGCEYPLPACQIKAHEGHLVTYIRKLEAELGIWNSESHDIQKAIVTLEGEVADQVRRAEEAGYARGVADMRKQGFCVEPQRHEA